MLMQVSIHRAVSRCLRKQYMAAKVVKNAYFYKQKQFRQEFSYNTYSYPKIELSDILNTRVNYGEDTQSNYFSKRSYVVV